MCSKLVIFYFLITLCLFDLVSETSSLKPDGSGVCVVKKSLRKTRNKAVWVSINKWCGKKKCVVKRYRPESYTVTSNQTVCCNGWQYQSEEDICTPLCSTGCDGGRCISPEICQCDPPTILEPEHRNSCLKPTCDSPCVNAECHWNNTCICHSDFVSINATHCAQNCDPGYNFDDKFVCTPQCDKNCSNGHCTGPNVCTCNEGYLLKDNFTCEPRCENCFNADCVGPNICSCREGFKRVNHTHCEPKCDSCDGDCIGPNVCKCYAGYEKVDEICKPICERGCKNGFCSAPNICTCNEGFVKKRQECKCHCSGRCNKNGECINGTCTYVKSEKRTKLVYPKGCKKASCRKIETIIMRVPTQQCCEGWEYNDDNDTCIAECPLGCEGGTCVAPNKCECSPPLIYKDNKCVIPKCETCVNSQCVDDNVCSCNPGYQKINNTHCDPICDIPCSNGFCIAPNICECNHGYENISDKCEPICHDCVHGVCIAPNQCKCFEGYSNSTGKCSPVCEKSCVNSDCEAPNRCTCHPKYRRFNETHCKPVCNDGYRNNPLTLDCTPQCDSCNHGSCIGPNSCKCDKGYEMVGLECKPVCHDCKNGICVAPNECNCFEGFTKNQGQCFPICVKSCINSYCSAPNVCSCNDGYIKNVTDPNKCHKPCKSSCNGHCIEGICTCDPGFVLENDTCVYRPMNCGSCEGNCSDGACWCADGRPCLAEQVESLEVASASGLAGLELSWLLGGAIGLLLIILVVVTIHRTWKKRKAYESKTIRDENAGGSVVYTVPGTLMNRSGDTFDEAQEEFFEKEDIEREVNERLLTNKVIMMNDNTEV